VSIFAYLAGTLPPNPDLFGAACRGDEQALAHGWWAIGEQLQHRSGPLDAATVPHRPIILAADGEPPAVTLAGDVLVSTDERLPAGYRQLRDLGADPRAALTAALWGVDDRPAAAVLLDPDGTLLAAHSGSFLFLTVDATGTYLSSNRSPGAMPLAPDFVHTINARSNCGNTPS
jgi:hypothetical protein